MAATASGDRYVLCSPRGGINDMVQQIMVCLSYCERTGRKCVVDTVRTPEFQNNLFELFDISHICVSPMSPREFYAFVKDKKTLTIYPSGVTYETIDTFCPIQFHTERGTLFRIFDELTVINSSKLYDEDIVCHFSCGGGPSIQRFLMYFSPQGALLETLKERYRTLGPNYLAVHIRNTDYKSDVETFLEANRTKINSAEKVFLASDSFETVNHFCTEFGDKVYTFSKLVPGTRPQHYQPSKSQQFAIDSFCDFILLTLGKDYIYSCPHSGFSKNANSLFMNAAYREKYRTLISC